MEFYKHSLLARESPTDSRQKQTVTDSALSDILNDFLVKGRDVKKDILPLP